MIRDLPSLLEKTFPIPQRFRSRLPHDIADLSQLLTNQRGQRSLSYLTRPDYLSAYLHYFLHWNIYRLCFLLPDFDFHLKEETVITDIGCGPLTFTCALWICRPDLRGIPIEINCIDRSGPVLEAGEKFFNALSGADNKWKINLIKKEIDFRKTNLILKNNKKASLVCAVNVFNEVYDKLPHSDIEALRQTAENAAKLLHNEINENSRQKDHSSIFIVEPGVPRSGKFISLLRDELLKLGHQPVSPCTHNKTCPFLSRQKEKWCHFAFSTENAPKELLRLSIAAKLPKERLVLSYLLTSNNEKINDNRLLRVISDSFPLSNEKQESAVHGRYACSSRGLILLKGGKHQIQTTASGSLVEAKIYTERDEKSGALTGEIK